MLDTYLILCGPLAERAQALVPELSPFTNLRPIYQTRSCTFWGSKHPAHLPLPNGQGVIVGTIFPRTGPFRAVSTQDQSAIDQLSKAPLEILKSRFWGSYLLCTEIDGEINVSRDPSGSLPCYYHIAKDGVAIASDAGLLADLGFLRAGIAWQEMPRYLAAKDLPSAQTGIVGLRELLAGSSLKITSSGACETSTFWSPWDHVRENDSDGVAEISEKIARVVGQSCSAWQSVFNYPLVLVSGGLDSSVVVASMHSDERRISYLTMVADDPVGDEREYVQALTNTYPSEIIDAFYDLQDVDLDQSATDHLPKPVGRIHEVAMYKAVARRAHAISADSVFSGNGGDNIFYNSRSVRVLFDRLRSAGISRQVLGTVADFSKVTGASFFNIAIEAFKFAPRKHRPYRWPTEIDFLTDYARNELRVCSLDHPWLARPKSSAPGKAGQIAMLLRMQNHIEGYLRPYGFPLINPLVTQPVLETLLAVPTWRMIEGGQDRMAVRRAYAKRLPAKILARRTKGSPSGFAMSVLDRKGPEIRERLLQGQLVKHGYLDARALAASLEKGAGMGPRYIQLLAFLDAEAWLTAWQNRTTRGLLPA
jgi:asparagine synthase (glutamine-hydrolysing)